MAKENTEDSDKNKLILKLGDEDSALIVRSNGEIELVSRELHDNDDTGNYVGDLEDLNRTFTLVLAFAAALENERLYHEIFQNLNYVLHKQWDKLPREEKQRIKDIRSHMNKPKDSRDADEWMNKWREEIERGKQHLEDYMRGAREDDPFAPEARPFDDMETRRRPKKRKVNPLNKLKDVAWNPYDDTLRANRVDGPHSAFRGDYKLDDPPDEED
jgi:hypothetical protein